MKRIILRKLSLVNFKGIRKLDVSFSELGQTTVRGRNHSGKTTLFDAFTWLLFGKDSQDRKQFALRTFDQEGKIIPKIPHEVSCVLFVGSEKVTLRRCFVEKWSKKRGSVAEEYTGNEEERYYNDVPCKKSEFDEKIAAIIPEQVFKFVTIPGHFCSQKPDVQRSMLFRMAGDVSNEDVAKGNAEFEQLLNQLVGKTLDEYKREIANKKKRIKEDMRDIPGRIDEIERGKPAPEDWNGLKSMLGAAEERMAEIDRIVSDKSKVFDAEASKRIDTLRHLQNLKEKLMKREGELKAFEANVRIGQKNAIAEYNAESARLADEAERLKSALEATVSDIEIAKKRREELLDEWRAINARKPAFDDNDLVCPTCKRPLESDDAERMREELTASFNRQKANALEDNARNGRQARKNLDSLLVRHSNLTVQLNDVIDKIAGLSKPAESSPLPDGFFENDSERLSLIAEISSLEKQIAEQPSPSPNAESDNLRQEKQALQTSVIELTSRLNNRNLILKADERKGELEYQMRQMASELASLERCEYTIQCFSKARSEAIEGRINALFSIVTFRLFDTQINGAEIETCECMMHNTPYSVLSLSERVNAGIDIINAICRSEDISAPIVIDNRESISSIIDTDSQVINLMVDETCETIKIQ